MPDFFAYIPWQKAIFILGCITLIYKMGPFKKHEKNLKIPINRLCLGLDKRVDPWRLNINKRFGHINQRFDYSGMSLESLRIEFNRNLNAMRLENDQKHAALEAQIESLGKRIQALSTEIALIGQDVKLIL